MECLLSNQITWSGTSCCLTHTDRGPCDLVLHSRPCGDPSVKRVYCVTLLMTGATPACWGQGSDSPVTLLVQVSGAVSAVLLVALRLVEAVGGALTHLGVLQGERTNHRSPFRAEPVRGQQKGQK